MLSDRLKSVVSSSSASRGLFGGGYGTDNGTSDRGLFAAGSSSGTYVNTIDYVTISSPGNATDFGDLWDGLYSPGGCSNGPNDRGVFGGGVGQPWDGGQNTIGYVTISTTSNTTDFGDLTLARYALSGCSNGSNERGVFWSGAGDEEAAKITIDYITINSAGNASDFGDTGQETMGAGVTSNGTSDRGVSCGGSMSGTWDEIEYITISSTGNATDFGDLTAASAGLAATSSGTGDVAVVGAIDSGGINNSGIDYFTISTTGNASDFGDLSVARHALAAVSNGLT